MSEWRNVPGLPLYEVSDEGWVRNKKTGRLMKHQMVYGYRSFGLWHEGAQRNYRASRLVLEAFVGPGPTPDHQAAHNDGGKLNNSLSNLRWATPSENIQDKWKHGTQHWGEQAYNAKLSVAKAEEIRSRHATGATYRGMAREYGVNRCTIRRVVKGNTWTGLPKADRGQAHA